MGRQQPMTGMDDVERQTPHGDTEILAKKTKAARDCRFLWAVVIITAVLTAGTIFTLEYFLEDTRYFVAIDSASSDLGPAAEGLSFNLTLGVASRSYGSKGCIEPGTYLEVSYRGVQLAVSEAEVGGLCARPRKSAEQHVAARAAAVPVGDVLDRLTVDMNKGVAVFDITLHLGGRDDWMSGCKGNRVGGAAVWCGAPSQEPTL